MKPGKCKHLIYTWQELENSLTSLATEHVFAVGEYLSSNKRYTVYIAVRISSLPTALQGKLEVFMQNNFNALGSWYQHGVQSFVCTSTSALDRQLERVYAILSDLLKEY